MVFIAGSLAFALIAIFVARQLPRNMTGTERRYRLKALKDDRRS